MIGAAIETLFDEQLNDWQLASDNYRGLEQVRTKTFEDNGFSYKVQFNPARILSSTAKIDAPSIRARRCFLCPDNLPSEQKGIPFKKRYQILVNPFPIFPRHLTVPDMQHTDQRIDGRIEDMLDLAYELDRYVIFYNGPKSGASAPDHFHFQAGNKGLLTLEETWKHPIAGEAGKYGKAVVWHTGGTTPSMLVIDSEDKADAASLFNIVYRSMETHPEEDEPMMNLIAWYENNRWRIFIFPRAAHRPSCYYAEGEANFMISPGSVDMGGVLITPLEKDFNRITLPEIRKIFAEVCISPDTFKKLLRKINQNIYE